MKVAVIGGGVIGATTAIALAEAGANVTVFEAEQSLFTRSSAAGFGSLTPFSDPFFSGSARDFAARSVTLYRSYWIPGASEKRGNPIDVGDEGLLDLFTDEPQVVEGATRLQADLVAAGYPAKLLTRVEAQKLEPELRGEFTGALWMDEPWIDVEQYFLGLRAWLETCPSITVKCGIGVHDVDSQKGRVTIRSSGDPEITYDAVIVATGLSSRRIRLPFEPTLTWVRGDAIEVRTQDGKPLLARHVYKKAAFITPRRDGRLLLGATYEVEDLDASELDNIPRNTISAGQAADLLHSNSSIVPRIRQCDIVRMWRGWRPKPIDAMPIIGAVDNEPVFVATGFIGLGITMAPAAAEAIVRLVMEGDASLIPPEFLPTRFMASKLPAAK